MDKLWAPWRINYIKDMLAKKHKICIFCAGVKSKSKNYVIFKTGYSISLLNIFPYNNGHMMVAPLRHTRDLWRLKEKEILDLCKTLNLTQRLLDKVLRPDGYNIGINTSRSAGAGIIGHLHIHIVPRWKGDTNFMPTLCNTKVISESLEELCNRLKDSLKYVKSKTN